MPLAQEDSGSMQAELQNPLSKSLQLRNATVRESERERVRERAKDTNDRETSDPPDPSAGSLHPTFRNENKAKLPSRQSWNNPASVKMPHAFAHHGTSTQDSQTQP